MPYPPAISPVKLPRLPCRQGGFTLAELLVTIVVIAALATLVAPIVDKTVDDSEMIAARATMQTLREAFVGAPHAPGYLHDMKHVPDFKEDEIKTHHLFQAPPSYPLYAVETRRGWRGPYVRNAQGVSNTNTDRKGRFPASNERRSQYDLTFLERGFYTNLTESPYGEADDITAADPWGNPIVLQVPVVAGSSVAQRFRCARLVSAGPDGVLDTPLNDLLAGIDNNGNTDARDDDLVIFLNRTDVYEANP